MTDVAVVGAQHPRRGGFARFSRLGQGRRFGLDHVQRVASRRLTLAARLILAVPRFAVAIPEVAVAITETLFAGPFVARAVVALPVVALPVVTGTLITGALITGTIVAEAVLAGTIITLAVIALAIVALALAARPVVPLTIIALAILAIVTVAVLPVAEVAIAALIAVLAFAAGLFAAVGGLAFRLGFRRLGGAGLFFEVDIVAGDELVAPDDLGHGTLRLHGAQDPEIMLGVLKIVLGEHPVAGRAGVTRQLLVLLIHVLGGAANLDAVRPVGIEGPVCVVLRFATAATAAAIAAPLTLHTLEISHALGNLLQT